MDISVDILVLWGIYGVLVIQYGCPFEGVCYHNSMKEKTEQEKELEILRKAWGGETEKLRWVSTGYGSASLMERREYVDDTGKTQVYYASPYHVVSEDPIEIKNGRAVFDND